VSGENDPDLGATPVGDGRSRFLPRGVHGPSRVIGQNE